MRNQLFTTVLVADVVARGYSGYNTRWALKVIERVFPPSEERVLPEKIVKNCVKQLTLLRGYIEKIVEDAKCCNFYFWVFTILGRRLFNIINDLPTVFEVVTNIAKKQVKEKSSNPSQVLNWYVLALPLVVLILAHELEVVEDAKCKFISSQVSFKLNSWTNGSIIQEQ
uniref:Uncharacterized protein n=1 Tax=Cucumis melo TaxID=3656 RepID=A0A9I9EIT0_CUCME